MRLFTYFGLFCVFGMPLACGGDDANSAESSSGGSGGTMGSNTTAGAGGGAAGGQGGSGGSSGTGNTGSTDTSTTNDSTAGAAGEASGGSDSTGSGGASGGPGSGETSGSTSSDGTSGSTSSDGTSGSTSSDGTSGSTTGNSCPSTERQECEWESFGGLACDAATCCGEVSCFEARCLASCTLDTASIDTLTPDFHVLSQMCNVRGSVSVLREDGACERPIIYDFSSSYDMQEDSFEFVVTRFEPSLNDTQTSGETVQSVTWPSPGGPGSAVPATFGVNPSETKAVFTATLDTYESTSLELDLTTGTIRTLPGYLTDRMIWLDDSHYLVCALALGTHTPSVQQGLYHVDTSGEALEPTYVAGRFDCGALGVVDDEQLIIAGSPIEGGTDSALLSLPLSIIDEVIGGSRAEINAYTDADVQRIPRAVWELQGFFPAGRWFVSPANSEYTEYRIEALSINAGVLELGVATPLGIPNLAGFTPLYAGYDRLLMLDYQQAILVDFR